MEWLLLVLALLMILGNGIFVAAEFSLLTLDKHTVDQAVEEKARFSGTIQKATKQLSTQLSTAQVGITVTALLTGYLMEPSVGALLAPVLSAVGLPESMASGVALGIALVVTTLLSMLIGELIPKNLAIAAPMSAARIAVPFQYIFSLVFRPIIAFLNGTANKVLISMGIEPQEEGAAGRSPEELTALVRHSADEGKLDEQTADLLERTLSFSELTAEDVMTPRTRTVNVTKDSTAADIVDLARRTGYSRFPVADESLDDIVGVVHIKSALSVPLDNRQDAFAGGLMTEVSVREFCNRVIHSVVFSFNGSEEPPHRLEGIFVASDWSSRRSLTYIEVSELVRVLRIYAVDDVAYMTMHRDADGSMHVTNASRERPRDPE